MKNELEERIKISEQKERGRRSPPKDGFEKIIKSGIQNTFSLPIYNESAIIDPPSINVNTKPLPALPRKQLPPLPRSNQQFRRSKRTYKNNSKRRSKNKSKRRSKNKSKRR
jgi:hypothetical protein